MKSPSLSEFTKRNRKPIEIRRGAVLVKLHHGATTAAGKSCPQFSLFFKEPSGKQRVQNFSNLDEAKREGELLATRLGNGEPDVLGLRNSDAAELVSARQVLAPVGLTISATVSVSSEALPRSSFQVTAAGNAVMRHTTAAAAATTSRPSRARRYVRLAAFILARK